MTDKTEKATPYKLQKAKEKGRVSKSIDLNTSVLLIVMVIVGSTLWRPLLKQLTSMMTHLFYLAAHFSLSIDTIVKTQRFLLSTLINLWFPFALAALLSITVATIAQTGFVWSMHPLSPELNRLNIVQGFKRFFSSKLLFDAVKNSLKLIFVFSLFILSLRHEIPALLKLMIIAPVEHPALIMQLFIKLILELLLFLFALAILDKAYSSWKFKKDNRMSKQEVKDEYRQRDGDPKIKAKIRLLQQQLRQKTAALQEVKKADVIITNPSHLAIALKYERSTMPAPKVVCKAQGELAIQVRTLAQRHNIPIIQHKAFARALFATVHLNQWIGQEHFPIAANIFREIYRQRERASC
ncbi:MAG: EscU/YscU/HrcU family type III secretion system export apparatus switch protein [Tatlockia sp.]|nr:EscU/YscU/HrcU family type III secretion system export apparatus switch protein [Tatlockia sp.]